ncbi:MAG: hypothetical protein DMF62_08790 [Acidobacteria bacterium]|nr:MAG: hypothetical protein DMF62_08790 [Acidobacteriota bacterium]
MVAKAVQVAAPTNAGDPQEWLACVLRERFAEVVSNREAALSESGVEGVHDMRVAIRRLRSIISDFAEIAEKFPLKTVRKDLKRLADALGGVRDADVSIEALEKLREKADDEKVIAGIDIFTERFREKRTEAFDRLNSHLSPESIDELAAQFEKALDASIEQRELFTVTNLGDAQAEIISNRVDEFRKLADAFYDPFSVKRLHRLRIAGKHLRYAIELFLPDLQTDAKELAESVAKMQTHLGNVHDHDQWITEMRSGLTAKKNRELKGDERKAAEWLLARFARRRSKSYKSALELWSEWENKEVLQKLNTIPEAN